MVIVSVGSYFPSAFFVAVSCCADPPSLPHPLINIIAAIAALPLEAIVLETDCPYMAPEPVRGTRCDSSLIRYVGEYIAQLKGISAEEVFRTTAENARRVYGL